MPTTRQLLGRSLIVWIAFELIAAAQVRGPDQASVLAMWVRASARPFVDAAVAAVRTTQDLGVGMADARRLAVENTRLSASLEELENRYSIVSADLDALIQADATLEELPRFTGIPARCVFRDVSRSLLHVIVDDDPSFPPERDMPVVGAGGIVGRVIRVEGSSCWVEVANHPAAAIAITTRDGSVHGLAEGTGGLDFTVEYISHDARLAVGEELITSGADGIYPAGFPVAVVSRVRETDEPFLDIRARPLANIGKIRAVWLLGRYHSQDRSKMEGSP